MSDVLESLTKGIGAVLGVAAAALLAMVTFLPKLRNGLKGDKLDGDVMTRLASMEVHARAQDREMSQQDLRIHRYAVKFTRLVVVVIRLQGLLAANAVQVPPDLVKEIARLLEEPDDDELNALPKEKP